MTTNTLRLRPAGDRGRTAFPGLDSRHSFSFGDYFDPAHVRFRGLRVLNDDRLGAGGGFPTHPHADAEIVSFVLSGRLAHADSTGETGELAAGEWQAMSAGTGVRHSEFNPSATEPAHFLQIWLTPDRRGHAPRYARLPADGTAGRWRVVVSPDGRAGSLPVHADAVIAAATVRPGDRLTYPVPAGRGAWVQVATGTATLNGTPLTAGDGASLDGPAELDVSGDGEVLVFDLA